MGSRHNTRGVDNTAETAEIDRDNTHGNNNMDEYTDIEAHSKHTLICHMDPNTLEADYNTKATHTTQEEQQ